jgi:hypothetical protein
LMGIQQRVDEIDLAAFFISAEEIYVALDKPKNL